MERAVEQFSNRPISDSTLILRPDVQALISAAHEGRFDLVPAEALDRLSRD